MSLRRGEGAYLAAELLVDLDISLRAVEGLLEPCEEHGDDDDGLEGLTEDDEEDRDGKDLGSHGGRCCTGLWDEMRGLEGEGSAMGTRMPGKKDSLRRSGHDGNETGRKDGSSWVDCPWFCGWQLVINPIR